MAMYKDSKELIVALINATSPGYNLTTDDITLSPAFPNTAGGGNNTYTTVRPGASGRTKGSAPLKYNRLIYSSIMGTPGEYPRASDRNGFAEDSSVILARRLWLSNYGISTDSEIDLIFESVNYTRPRRTDVVFTNAASYLFGSKITVALAHPEPKITNLDLIAGRRLANTADASAFVKG